MVSDLLTNYDKDELLNFLEESRNSFSELKRYSQEEINLTGLYYQNDKTGKFVDRFNSRVIFPVNNIAAISRHLINGIELQLHLNLHMVR